MMRDFADVSKSVVENRLEEEDDRASKKRRCALAEKKRSKLSTTLSLPFPQKQKKLISQMMRLQRGFPDFDLDGKEIYLDKVRGTGFFWNREDEKRGG